jgi:phosphoribosylamine--glycine ligase
MPTSSFGIAMKLLILDNDGEGCGLDLAWRAQNAGHEVRYWLPPTHTGDPLTYGDGMVTKPKEWTESMDWAELIVLTGNAKYAGPLAEYFGKGYPIFGSNAKASELELDRKRGQEVLEEYGVETLPYRVAESIEEALRIVVEEGKAFCLKPWGGEADKSMTCVPETADDAIFQLEKWKTQGLKGALMLQERVEGVEIGISGFFGPGGWNTALEESFEYKRFLNGDLGENTGEMGTVIRHVKQSKLFDKILEPLTDYLHLCRYVGDCNVNCIVDKHGSPWPLEFTCRLGWPDFCIRQSVFKGDPVGWMADLLYGRDTLEVSADVALGVVMAHGDFPKHHDPQGTWEGYPIEYDSDESLHWQMVKDGEAPFLAGGKVKRMRTRLTAGTYVLVASGTGKTVSAAKRAAYSVVESVRWPSNIMYRTDLGDSLAEELPDLQVHGYATGMRF